MDKLRFYEIDCDYINFLSAFAEHLFLNAKNTQKYSRKYVGIIFEINEFKYFASLSSLPSSPRNAAPNSRTTFGVLRSASPAQLSV
ncbi:MAG: type III toxin-antitoxin system ToxN/AbiQ family toxin [Spirochaetales bacterium]|nr:type III toxin-antitoxin system ToxN/AbiQ family toxin [Spirochaetales bacterium]MBR6061764.1 type III toxin-antitoxin system ToxN/AbiQ family toxin [Spirochaetales bacterium]